MGTKEEGAKTVLVRGYSGKIRPQQADAGKCKLCKEPVFVDPDDAVGVGTTTVDRVTYVHHGCET